MHTTARTAAAPLLIAALLLGAGHTPSATAGASTRTYTDSADGISFQYPATWKALLRGKNTGYPATIAKVENTFIAPDFSAALLEMVGGKKPAGAALQAVGLKLFKDGNTMAGPIATGRTTIGKVSFYSWTGTVRPSGGGTALAALYAGAGSAGTYYIATLIAPHHAAGPVALRGILDSVTIR